MNRTKASSWLFDGPSGTGNKEIILWWEARRLHFNGILVVIGFVCCWIVLAAGSAAVKPGQDFVEPLAMLAGPVIYLIFVNICYTFGWFVDVFTVNDGPRKWLFKVGLLFSIIVTALPATWAVIAWLITLHTGQKLD